MKFKKIIQRGQVLALYGLRIPFLLLFVGVGLDLGWYYLNVSRLQNAADAAALAGAQALVKKNAVFDNYYLVQLASNQLPADFDTYSKVFKNTFESGVDGVLLNYKSEDDAKETLVESQVLAEQYTRINLGDEEPVFQPTDLSKADWKTLNATDAWNKSAKEDDRKVSGTIDLKYQIVDAKNDKYGPLYYVVELKEKIRHFLLPGWFEAMDAPVRAVVLLQPHYKGLIEPMEYFEKHEVIDNWEYTNKYKGTTGFYSGKWNHYMSGNTSSTTGIAYSAANPYRTEGMSIKTTKVSRDGGQQTAANGNKFYSASEVDSINIDFQAEVRKKFSTDWDLGFGTAAKLSGFSEYTHVEKDSDGNPSWGIGNGDDKRILFNVEFDEAFPTRNVNQKADVLWARIESDPLKNPYTGAGVTIFNSVRQITLNFNSDNSIVEGSGEKQHYKYRPYVIFYTGPENIDYAVDSNGVLIRHSQPVVINLNYDTNAIIYMPNSPVVINGNEHKLNGFVIAKCYLHSVTEEDMLGNSSIKLYDGFNKMEDLPGNFKVGYDSEGQTVYFRSNDLLTKEEIDALYSDDGFRVTTSGEKTGNIIVTEEVQAPKYLLLDYSKEDSNSTYEVPDENGKHDENATFANYVNSTYKEKFKAFSGLTDSQISAVTFPDEDYNFTEATYWVATADLLPYDPDPTAAPVDDKYVKVMVGEETRYIAKSKLPYVKVRTNKNYFYVCVYDLKTAWDGSAVNSSAPYAGVRMIDGSYNDKEINDSYGDIKKEDKSPINALNAKVSDADIFINPNDKWCDSWGISARNNNQNEGLIVSYMNN